MIKGINRQVVEVRETGSDYFERILFFVKPEYASVSEGKIRERAGLIAGRQVNTPATKVKRDMRRDILKTAAFIVLGFAAGIVTGIII